MILPYGYWMVLVGYLSDRKLNDEDIERPSKTNMNSNSSLF
jgi:hypothetical protein